MRTTLIFVTALATTALHAYLIHALRINLFVAFVFVPVATTAVYWIGRHAALRRHRRILDTRWLVTGQCPACRSTEVTSNPEAVGGLELTCECGIIFKVNPKDGLVDRIAQ